TVMAAERPGAVFTFFFEGDLFGVFDIGGPEVGQLSIWIDDKPASLQVTNTPGYRLHQLTGGDSDTLLNRFNRYCNNRYRGQYDLIKLSGGRHKVTISISPLKGDKREVLGPNQLTDITENPEKYDQT